jgi:hypothetical protein
MIGERACGSAMGHGRSAAIGSAERISKRRYIDVELLMIELGGLFRGLLLEHKKH